MAEYRKKPVVIEAVKWDGWKFAEVPKWLSEAINATPGELGHIMRIGDNIIIHTLEGAMTATPGDFIIRGVEGELYSCKPEIFAKTYELVWNH